jgi:hypothetical protein
MELQRDPKTGRMLKKGVTAENAPVATVAKKKVTIAKTPKPVKTGFVFEIGQKLERLLTSPLTVFSKKDALDKPAKMGPGANVILKKLAEIGPTGTHMVQVKKPGSSRIFYTTEENVPS